MLDSPPHVPSYPITCCMSRVFSLSVRSCHRHQCTSVIPWHVEFSGSYPGGTASLSAEGYPSVAVWVFGRGTGQLQCTSFHVWASHNALSPWNLSTSADKWWRQASDLPFCDPIVGENHNAFYFMFNSQHCMYRVLSSLVLLVTSILLPMLLLNLFS